MRSIERFLDAGKKKDLVVHAESEDDGEHEHGHDDVHGFGGTGKTEDACPDTLLKHEHDQPECPGHREAVHHDSLDGNQDRLECDEEHDARDPQDERDDRREFTEQILLEIEAGRREPTNANGDGIEPANAFSGHDADLPDEVHGTVETGRIREHDVHERHVCVR